MRYFSKDDLLKPESVVADKMASLFTNLGWSFEREYKLPNGKLIDFLVTAYDRESDTMLRFGFECKAKLIEGNKDAVKAAHLANYLEQASAYARELSLPVFVGPFCVRGGPSSCWTGGLQLSALSAFNIFGNRMNVGTFLWRGIDSDSVDFFMILRGLVWQYNDGYLRNSLPHGGRFDVNKFKFITSEGSKKQRLSVAIPYDEYIGEHV